MSVIVISSGPYCRREAIAGQTAQTLGYRCVGDELFEQASKAYNTPAARLIKAMEDAPSILSLSAKTRTRFLAYYQAALLSEIKNDNVVCHGRSNHMFISGVSHVLKARLTADLDDQVRMRMNLENLTEEKARLLIIKEEKDRRKWSESAFGQDESNPGLFDLVINVSQTDPEKAVALMVNAVKDPKFHPMTYSMKCMRDIELAGRVRAALITSYPDVKVQARDGHVIIHTTASSKKDKEKYVRLIREQAAGIEGVSGVEARVDLTILAARSSIR